MLFTCTPHSHMTTDTPTHSMSTYHEYRIWKLEKWRTRQSDNKYLFIFDVCLCAVHTRRDMYHICTRTKICYLTYLCCCGKSIWAIRAINHFVKLVSYWTTMVDLSFFLFWVQKLNSSSQIIPSLLVIFILYASLWVMAPFCLTYFVSMNFIIWIIREFHAKLYWYYPFVMLMEQSGH